MHNDNQVNDTTVSEEDNTPNENQEDSNLTSRQQLLSAIANAVSAGNMSSKQARDFRLMNMGLSQGHFTRKQTTTAQRKTRRNMQKASRRANRSNAQRGQKKSGRK